MPWGIAGSKPRGISLIDELSEFAQVALITMIKSKQLPKTLSG
jgi:hypothetical protein